MSSFITTNTSSSTTTTTPVAGWLTKMISLPFGRSRWISRFFVLLDSELRFYKDEHSDCASQIMNLKEVCQVIPTRTAQHPFCFRLEPYKSDTSTVKPWIIECKSQVDMESWISAIQFRINKYNSVITSPSLYISSPPKTPNTNETSSRVVSSYSMMNNTCPEFYRVATLPLRCTNLSPTNSDEDEKESLLMRRRKKLAPIVTQQYEQQMIMSPPSTCSSTSLISPTGAVLGTLISPGIIDRYSQYKKQVSNDSNTTQCQGEEDYTIKERCESPSSPTYLKYKQRFHL